MITRLGLMGNLRKMELIPLSRRIIRWCRRQGINVHAEKELYHALVGNRPVPCINCGSLDSCDLICLMGGDGFLLTTARFIYPSTVPILPVNLGSLGFHTQIYPEEIIRTLNRFHKNSIPTVPRFLLEVKPSPKRKDIQPIFAMNDALLIKETQSRMIQIEVFVDDVFLGKVPCDGMLVSSATGSMAYNLSTGGPLVHPNLDVMTLLPICPHTLSIRPLVLPKQSRINLRYVTLKDREEAKFCIDGQIWWSIPPGENLVITTAAAPLLIAEAHPGEYYRKLNSVVRWGSSLMRKNPDSL